MVKTKIETDIKIINKEPSKYRYGQRECTIVAEDGCVFWYNFIMITNLQTLESRISEFTEFFFDSDKMLNLEISTKKQNYGTIIIAFLNYIFIDREEPEKTLKGIFMPAGTLKSIEDINIPLGEEFLNKFARGELSSRKNKNGKSRSLVNNSIKSAKGSLTNFYKWIFDTKISGNRKKYKLKHICKDDFVYETRRYRNPNRPQDNDKNKLVLKNIFAVKNPNKASKPKIEKPSELIVFTLIEVARVYDPMIAFPIALEAFAGLRRGEVCQLHRQRIILVKPIGTTINFCINLMEEQMLRKDGVRTGKIKRRRCQLVYPAFLHYLDEIYKEHKEFLKQMKLDTDPYGALIFGDNGMAMRTATYGRRFNALIKKVIEVLDKMKNRGNEQASIDWQMLSTAKMTPHALRRFFSKYVARFEKTHMLAAYRGDLDLNSALIYLKDNEFTVSYQKQVQNSFEKHYNYILKGDVN